MGTNIYELNCPFCDKLYKLPRDKVLKHAGKSIHCRKCGKPFSIPVVPPDEPPAEAEFEDIPIAYEVASPAVEPPAVEARVSAQAPAIEPPIPEPLAAV